MKAIILSAGQGRRLLPMTADTPKCALPIQGRAVIEWQLDALEAAGVDQVTVVAGFGVARVESLLGQRSGSARTAICYNPFFEVADNLMSCWIARADMSGDFVLLNGDTLFEPGILNRLLASPEHPITLATDHKSSYDADDMKVQLSGARLTRVGKDIPPAQTDGESIGLMLFRGRGAALFREQLEQSARDPAALRRWYLSIIDQLGRGGHVWTQSMEGMDWAEVDYPLDLLHASIKVSRWAQADGKDLAGGSSTEMMTG